MWGDRCDKCGEPYTPFALRKGARSGGGFVAEQCNCFAFGGEGDVPLYIVTPGGSIESQLTLEEEEVPLP